MPGIRKYFTESDRLAGLAMSRRKYYEKNKQLVKERNTTWAKAQGSGFRKDYHKIRNTELRLSALLAYGNRCACCGESKLEFLSLDHVNGNGTQHRRSIPGRSLPLWLRRNGYPAGFQVLCHNCNFSKGIYGVCPHKMEK